MTPTNSMVFSATLHCLTGCAIGEVIGMVIATGLNLSNTASVAISVFLAFLFGYLLTSIPLLKKGMSYKSVFAVALAADTVSIAVMELADNGFILLVPGAIDATLSNALFWLSLAASLAVAFVVALPVNRYLMSKGKGHAVVHEHHH